MFEIENLTLVEHTLGFRYPPSFHAGAAALARLAQTGAFAARFPRAVLIDSPAGMQSLGLPPACVAFMAEAQPAHVDVYFFDLSSPGPEYRAAVFAEHAVVYEWPNFADFWAWISRQCSPAG